MIEWKDELPDRMMGSSDTMHFTLDSSGEFKDSKNYTTIGSTIKVNGTITAPTGYIWNIKVSSSEGWSKEYDNIPTGQQESFDIKTNFGSTKVTIKIWSVNGSADTGVQGTIVIDS